MGIHFGSVTYSSTGHNALHQGVAGHGGDAAHVLVVSAHLDVPLLPPLAAPGVLDQPVVPGPDPRTLLVTVAHRRHPVVQVYLGAYKVAVHT